jgi:hypothetical protein
LSIEFNPGNALYSGGSSKKVEGPVSAEESQSRQDALSAAREAAGVVASAADTDVIETQKKVRKIPERSSPLTERDLMDVLFKLQKAPNADNKQILASMIQHGIAATTQAMDDIETLMKGQKGGNILEAAVVSYSKGLKNSKTVGLLSSFFANDIQLSERFTKLQTSLAQFSTFLSAHQGVLDASLQSGVSAIIQQLSDDLKRINKKSDGPDLPFLNRGESLKDLKALSAFLGGLDHRLSKSKSNLSDVSAFRSGISQLKRAVGGAIDALASQLVLSKDSDFLAQMSDTFSYWQVPNPMAQAQKSIDILMKKKKHSKEIVVDPESTRIVLRFETPELGEVSVIIDVKENKLSYVFETTLGETKQFVTEMSAELKDRMDTLNYDLVGLKTVHVEQEIDLKEYLLPTFDLDKLHRIITEA